MDYLCPCLNEIVNWNSFPSAACLCMFQCPVGLQRVGQISGNGIRRRAVGPLFLGTVRVWSNKSCPRCRRVIVVRCSFLLNLPTYINRLTSSASSSSSESSRVVSAWCAGASMIYRPPVAVAENRRNWFSDIAHIYRLVALKSPGRGRGGLGHTRS